MDEWLMATSVGKILEDKSNTITGSIVFQEVGACEVCYKITQAQRAPTIYLTATYDVATHPKMITRARSVMVATVITDPQTICDTCGGRTALYDVVASITNKRLDKVLQHLYSKAFSNGVVGVNGTSNQHVSPIEDRNTDISDLIRRVIMRHITSNLDINPIVCRDDTCDRAVYKLYGIDGYCIELTTYNVGSRDENKPVRLIVTIKDLAMDRAVLHKAILVDSPLDAALLRLEQYHNYLQNNDRNKVIGMLQDFCKVE